jgi:hypothetical protein
MVQAALAHLPLPIMHRRSPNDVTSTLLGDRLTWATPEFSFISIPSSLPPMIQGECHAPLRFVLGEIGVYDLDLIFILKTENPPYPNMERRDDRQNQIFK